MKRFLQITLKVFKKFLLFVVAPILVLGSLGIGILLFTDTNTQATPGMKNEYCRKVLEGAWIRGGEFLNPMPDFQMKTFRDFLKWSILERPKTGKARKKEYYPIEIMEEAKHILQNSIQKRPEGITITWVGHSTALIRMGGFTFLTDPIWSDRASPFSFAGPQRFTPAPIKMEDLPPIDYVLISHNHYDHLDKKTIQKLGKKPQYMVPLRVGKLMKTAGAEIVREMDWYESHQVTRDSEKEIEIIFIPAQHFSARSLWDRNETLWGGWIIQSRDLKSGKKTSMAYLGDTGYFEELKDIGKKYGPIDVALVPIGGYEPQWFMSAVHLNPVEALQAFRDLGGRHFVPVHWGSYPMADDTPADAMRDLKLGLQKIPLKSDELWVMKPGETREVR